MRDLRFLNPTSHPGLNVTVHDGAKWADVVTGDPLLLLETDNEDGDYGDAIAIGATHFGHIIDIPDFILRFEHDSSCRTLEGLGEALDAAYGAGKWGADGVTVLAYWVF